MRSLVLALCLLCIPVVAAAAPLATENTEGRTFGWQDREFFTVATDYQGGGDAASGDACGGDSQ